MKDGDKVLSEWMMFTFFATDSDGVNVDVCEEGELFWHPIEDVKKLKMAEGDFHILDYMVHGSGIIYGTFTYTPEFKLLSYRLDPG